MKATKLLFGSLVGIATVSVIAALAQDEFQISFRGTCQTLNDAGQIVTTSVNNNTLLQQAVNNIGRSNLNSLAVIYHVNGGENSGQFGDTIEVINTTNGATVYTNFALFFGEGFGQSITNVDQTQIASMGDVFTDQSIPLGGEDMGTAQVNQRIVGKNGQKTLINGTLIYHVAPEGTNNEKICNASFTASKPFNAP